MGISSGLSLKRTTNADQKAPVNHRGDPAGAEAGGSGFMVHAVLVEHSGLGILMMGDSGIGKTACGLDLVSRGGFWVADDAVILERRGEALFGRGHERTRRLVAVRGLGIVEARSLLGFQAIHNETRVNLIIWFVRDVGKKVAEGDGQQKSLLERAGVELPCRRLSVTDAPCEMADRVMDLIGEFTSERDDRIVPGII
jgi:serine kinase of HPr protein (carbohydrate metabolism regulator)